VTGNQAELARGGEILLSFIVLQTYDENEDALDMLEVSGSTVIPPQRLTF
jgi:hypothetical protein